MQQYYEVSPYDFEIAVLKQAKAWLSTAAESQAIVNDKFESLPAKYILTDYEIYTEDKEVFNAAFLLNRVNQQKDLAKDLPMLKIKQMYRMANECYDLWNNEVHWIIRDYEDRQQGLNSIHVPEETQIEKRVIRLSLSPIQDYNDGIKFLNSPLASREQANLFIDLTLLFFYIDKIRWGLYGIFGSEIADAPLQKRHFLPGDINRNFDDLYADLIHQKLVQVDNEKAVAYQNQERIRREFDAWLKEVKGVDFYDLYWERELPKYQQHLTVDMFKEFLGLTKTKNKKNSPKSLRDDIFQNVTAYDEAMTALRMGKNPVINDKGEYSLGCRQKGAIAAWVSVLKDRGDKIFTFSNAVMAAALNKEIKGLDLYYDGGTLDDINTPIARKYYTLIAKYIR